MTSADALAWVVKNGLEACDRDDRTSVEFALARVGLAHRQTNAMYTAVRAAVLALRGRLEQAVALFREALNMEASRDVEARIRERFIALLVQVRALDQARQSSFEALEHAPGDIALEALDLSIRAEFRAAKPIRLAILKRRASRLQKAIRGRVYLRLSSAAYSLRKLDLAEKYAHTAAAIAIDISTHRLAALAYRNLAYLYAGEIGDASAGRRYLDLVSTRRRNQVTNSFMRRQVRCIWFCRRNGRCWASGESSDQDRAPT